MKGIVKRLAVLVMLGLVLALSGCSDIPNGTRLERSPCACQGILIHAG